MSDVTKMPDAELAAELKTFADTAEFCGKINHATWERLVEAARRLREYAAKLAEVERERDVWKSKAEHRGRCASEMASWAGEMEAAAREVLSAAHLRTHGFPEGDISDLDFSKMLPAIVRLDAALSPAPAADKPANEAKEKGNG